MIFDPARDGTPSSDCDRTPPSDPTWATAPPEATEPPMRPLPKESPYKHKYFLMNWSRPVLSTWDFTVPAEKHSEESLREAERMLYHEVFTSTKWDDQEHRRMCVHLDMRTCLCRALKWYGWTRDLTNVGPDHWGEETMRFKRAMIPKSGDGLPGWLRVDGIYLRKWWIKEP